MAANIELIIAVFLLVTFIAAATIDTRVAATPETTAPVPGIVAARRRCWRSGCSTEIVRLRMLRREPAWRIDCQAVAGKPTRVPVAYLT